MQKITIAACVAFVVSVVALLRARQLPRKRPKLGSPLGEVEEHSRHSTLGAETPNAAFDRKLKVSKALAEMIGNGPLSRVDVVKRLWVYIRKNSLQDANERRLINADDKLRVLFCGKERVSIFEMTNLINAHLGELDPSEPEKRLDG